MKLLIPGGAGYIGSHMVRYAQQYGHEVVVLDDFSTGHKWAVKDCEILQVNLIDQDKLSQLLKGRHFDGVIHFAGKSLVGESINNPEIYYRNNVVGTMNLVKEMLKNDNYNFIFSSSASIFGNPVTEKISEDHPKNPINPYGQSKFIVENILQDYCTAYGMNAICFRYFNAAGADISGEIGESHDPETHLIPSILKSVISKKNELKIFGDDYPTPDGTCIRDYIHVSDLAHAHFLGLEKCITSRGHFDTYNLGNGNGFSIIDLINSVERVTQSCVNYEICERREGDPPILIANIEKAVNILSWKPVFTSIDSIIGSAMRWHQKINNKEVT